MKHNYVNPFILHLAYSFRHENPAARITKVPYILQTMIWQGIYVIRCSCKITLYIYIYIYIYDDIMKNI